MKKIVRGNDFMLRVPVRRIVNGEKERFPLPACEEIEVNLVNAFRRRKMEYTIGVEDDSLLEVSVHSSEMALGAYALEVKGKLFGCSWRSNEYEQIMLVDNNASGDTEFGETDEGEDSVEMDTAIVVLAPVTVIDGNFKVLIGEAVSESEKKTDTKLEELKDEISNGVRDGKWLPLKRGRKSDGTFVDDCVEMGYQSEATGYGSTAMGYNCKASGNTAHAENANCTASGDNSHAEGEECVAKGKDSHAEGRSCTASGDNSHAEGYFCTASGAFSHAEGDFCTADNRCAHAEGYSCTASGENSHAEGQKCTATRYNAHAEGYSCTASMDNSHAEGYSCTASGSHSHAEGCSCTASGAYSHAEGYSCTASGDCCHAEGCSNYDDASFIDMVGVGNGNDVSRRKNASVIYIVRDSFGDINISAPKNGYQYLIDVGGYKGQEIGNAKSVQEVFADLEARITAIEKRLADTMSAADVEAMFNGGTGNTSSETITETTSENVGGTTDENINDK